MVQERVEEDRIVFVHINVLLSLFSSTLPACGVGVNALFCCAEVTCISS